METILNDRRLRYETYERGQLIYDPHRFDRALGLVLSGQIEVRQGGTPRPLLLRYHRTGDVFGAAALFSETPHYASELEALIKTRVLFFPQEVLTEYMTKDFRIAENYLSFLTGRIQFLTARLSTLLAGSAEAQLMEFLTEQADENGLVILDTGISSLARRLGISRASLYRAFTSLENQSMLKKTNRTIELQNVR